MKAFRDFRGWGEPGRTAGPGCCTRCVKKCEDEAWLDWQKQKQKQKQEADEAWLEYQKQKSQPQPEQAEQDSGLSIVFFDGGLGILAEDPRPTPSAPVNLWYIP